MRDHLRSAAEIGAWTQALVRVPSPQTDLMEREPAVLEFLAYSVEPILHEIGLPPRRSAMGDLIVEVDGASEGPTLLLVAYAMTHPASSMREPYRGEIVDTPAGPAVRGRGAAEQKGALAAALASLAAVRKAGLPRGKLVFAVATAGETGRHDAIESILAALQDTPQLAIVAIGTGSRISLGNKGRVDVDVVVRGKAAHSSTPWLGVSAIEGARAVLDRLASLPLGDGRHPDLGSATLTPTRIETGPDATHTVPNLARVTFDRRLLPGEDPEPAIKEIRSALADLDTPCAVEVHPGPFMHPAEVARDGRLLASIRRGLAARGDPAPGCFYSHAALDAGYLIHVGCEAAMWGPGDMALFHTDDELVHIDQLRLSAEGYLAFVEGALAVDGPSANGQAK